MILFGGGEGVGGLLFWCGDWIFKPSLNWTNMKFTSRPLICILDKHEGEKVENTSPIVFVTFKVYCHWTDMCFLNCCYGYLTFWFSMNHRTSRFLQIYQQATNLHNWQEGSRTMYKKKLHYWAAVAKYDYKDKQWISGQ